MKTHSKVCKFCGEQFSTTVKNKMFCSYDHQIKNTINITKKAKEKMLLELDKTKWTKSHLGMVNKFYEIFGVNHSCNLCNMSFQDALDEYSVPLFIELMPNIRDWKVMNVNNWKRYCLGCYTEILIQKELLKKD